MRRLLISAAALAASEALAVEPDELLADPALEARARAISREIRCVVCQSESIDDSNAPLARDLRLLVRERINAGDGDEAVRDFLVARYGDYVLLKPRVQTNTLALWLAPMAAGAVGGVAALLFLRGRREREKPKPLTAEELDALAKLDR
ncbi:MAG: cytochrome c-type biogenesis protein [Parvularculaceae bacterium]|nr:cytochrome c-type biogenesis protein [Parvularculaceae bacterium]